MDYVWHPKRYAHASMISFDINHFFTGKKKCVERHVVILKYQQKKCFLSILERFRADADMPRGEGGGREEMCVK